MSDITFATSIASTARSMQDTKAIDASASLQLAPMKPIAQAIALGSSIQSQVLGGNPLMTSAEIDQTTNDFANFSEREQDQACDLFMNNTQPGTLDSMLKFDPGVWEKNISVLIASIVTVNTSRQAAARTAGTFVALAATAAIAQGLSIVKAGEAAMNAAVTAAVGAGALAVGGAAMSLKGQNQKHMDIKSNQTDALKSRQRANELNRDLEKNSFIDNPKDSFTTITTVEGGRMKQVEFQKSGNRLTPDERATLSDEITAHNKNAENSNLQSQLNEKQWSRNMTLGQTMTSLAMVVSAMVSSAVRLEEFKQQSNQVYKQSEQTIDKGIADEARQRTSEETGFQQKLMEALTQVMQSRNATMSTLASAVRA
jgi:hypothetical protein